MVAEAGKDPEKSGLIRKCTIRYANWESTFEFQLQNEESPLCVEEELSCPQTGMMRHQLG